MNDFVAVHLPEARRILRHFGDEEKVQFIKIVASRVEMFANFIEAFVGGNVDMVDSLA